MNETQPLADPPAQYPIEVPFPDISPYREGTDGIPYVHTFRADAPGPHVAVCAIVHGNEPCGAIALDRFLREDMRPVRGTLSFAFINVDAYSAFDKGDPLASRWVDEDFNRLWSAQTLDGERQSVELVRARQLRPFVESIDLMLDIHSMGHRTVPLMMAGPSQKGVEFARAVGTPQIIVIDEGHAAGPRLRDYAPFIGPQTDKNALLVECGQHWAASSAAVAISTAMRFLQITGAIDAADGMDPGPPPGEPQTVLRITDRVTVETDHFVFAQNYCGMEVIEEAGTVIARDGERAVRTPYSDCVLIMPTRRLWPGQTAVRLGHFVSQR
ncbi:MAG: succinylglutamate desuccinylase/aspartoacylase family protein [Pseudomonadota bacterium]